MKKLKGNKIIKITEETIKDYSLTVSIKLSKLIEQEKIASSITVTPEETPEGNKYNVLYYLKEKDVKGNYKLRTVIVDEVIEDVEFKDVTNKFHIPSPFVTYKTFTNKESGFYINLYR
jgi:hypothetical protein